MNVPKINGVLNVDLVNVVFMVSVIGVNMVPVPVTVNLNGVAFIVMSVMNGGNLNRLGMHQHVIYVRQDGRVINVRNVPKVIQERIVQYVPKDGVLGQIALNFFLILFHPMMVDIYVMNVKKITLDIIVLGVHMVQMYLQNHWKEMIEYKMAQWFRHLMANMALS